MERERDTRAISNTNPPDDILASNLSLSFHPDRTCGGEFQNVASAQQNVIMLGHAGGTNCSFILDELLVRSPGMSSHQGHGIDGQD